MQKLYNTAGFFFLTNNGQGLSLALQAANQSTSQRDNGVLLVCFQSCASFGSGPRFFSFLVNNDAEGTMALMVLRSMAFYQGFSKEGEH